MLISDITLRIGILTLFMVFSGILGFAVHHTRLQRRPRHELALAILFALLVYLPATIFISSTILLSPMMRAVYLLIGIGVVYLTSVQPDWLPARIWKGSFSWHFLGISMALASIWSISSAVLFNLLASLLLGIAALLAFVLAIHSAYRVS